MFRSWHWEWAPSLRKMCGCVPLPVSVHLLYGSPGTRRRPWPTGAGESPPLRDGWPSANHSQHSDQPLSLTRYRLGGKVNGKCDPLLNDFGGDKRWLIDTTYHTGDMHVTMCLCCWMWRVTWYARKSLPVPKTARCPGNACETKRFKWGCMDATSSHLCWMYVVVARRSADVGARQKRCLSSVARYQTEKKITTLSLSVVQGIIFSFAESHVIGIKHKHWETAECSSINNSCKRNG